ncbi:MAG: class I SAM-dependent methyltransferase [Sedimentisphaerales bacterium]|nr:class I SAM-dependent methyltransferase [Sedimentisphaerales bacterium]
MTDRKHRVCPVEKAGGLDNCFRRWMQNPRKIVAPYVKEGMTVLDIGCGPGFFTLPLAQLVGPEGRVIACDVQEGMLQKVRAKVQGTPFEQRITLHNCPAGKLGLSDAVDFALLFYVAHEIPDQAALFKELHALLIPAGKILLVEPAFHVSKAAFAQTLKTAEDAGFMLVARPRMFLSRAAVLSASR